ncbi:hypothetical protein ACP4OV_001013 [Aristida adscensionis]
MERNGGARRSPAGRANGVDRPAVNGQRRRPAVPLPQASVVRTMRHAIPENVRISARAKQLVQDCGGEFAAVVVNEAAERCRREGRRRMAPEDLLASLRELGLQRYAEPMATYLRRHREAAARAGAPAISNGDAPATMEEEDQVQMDIDDEFVRFLAQMMDDAAAGGGSSPAHLPGPN